MKYTAAETGEGKCFKVPNALADNFLKLANPKHITVLLWVLRHADTPESTAEIARQLHMDKEIVDEAVFFWIDNGLMLPVTDAAQPFTERAAPEKSEDENRQKARQKLGSSQASTEEILTRADESARFKYLLYKAQEIFGRTLSKAESSMLLSLTDHYGLPAEVILMLITYAVSVGRTGTNYIKTVGESWSEEGIVTLEAAESKINEMSRVNTLWNKFAAEVGAARKYPTKKQAAFFAKWTGEWGFSIEIIVCAYEKMIESIDKIRYAYMDKILASWHEAGADTVEKIDALEKERTAKIKKTDSNSVSFSTHSFTEYADNADLIYGKEDDNA